MQGLDYRIVDFVRLLRVLGLRVSVSETLDAIRALTFVNLNSRQQVKAALQATLLKNMDQLPLFEEAFALFFSPPEAKEQRKAKREAEKNAHAEAMNQAEAELVFQGQGLDLSVEQKELYHKMPQEGKERIQDFLRRTSDGHRYGDKLDVNFKPIVENLVRGQLDYWKRLLGEELPMFDVLPTGEEETDELVMDVTESLRDHHSNYLYEDLKNIAEKDLPKVNILIRRLSKRLASRISRRYRRSKRADQIDLRRSIRSSLSYGGALVELKYKTRPRNKPKFVLLCDVSGSMARYASFVLQFIYGLSSVLSGIESFVFSEDLERVSLSFSRGHNFEQTMAEVMNKSKEWGGGTNLAKALDTLLSQYPHTLSKNTVIIVVSDTKTLEAKRAALLLKGIGDKVKDIIWLNTLPGKQWPQQKSTKAFEKVSRMYECYTLAHLEKIMYQQLN